MDMRVEHLSKMSNLRLLIVKYSGNISGSPKYLPNKLRYVEWYEYPSMYLPSSFQPNQLVELILKSSNIKQLWKNKKYLPNLKTLDLRNSKKLVKILDFGEFPNLEWLNLKGCVKLVQLDPSIGLLKKLVYLNVKDCKKLESIPNNIFGLSSLKDLNMHGCSKVFNNPRHLKNPDISLRKKKKHDISESASHSQSIPSVFKRTILPHHSSPNLKLPPTSNLLPNSLHSLYCLRKVDISFCRLRQVPDAIQHLGCLEILYLGGNNFVTLPSLKDLSKLVYLNLEHCRLLESLPQLPFPTAIEWDHHKNKNWCRIGLVIFNCPKLGERERCSSMIVSWMIKLIQANPQSYPTYFNGIQIVTPGSEIPSWISNQRVGGAILINPPPTMHDNNNIIGLVCCVEFSMAPHDPTTIRSSPSRAHMTLQIDDSNGRRRSLTILPVILDRDLITTESNHLWLIYFPQELSYDILCEFMRVYIIRGEGFGMKVKNCGYHWVCKQDLEVFDLALMYLENSLSRKRKILEIEDGTQPQPQPQPKSFIS